jgi:5-methylcytosine-specific restriction endonuclease McrA
MGIEWSLLAYPKGPLRIESKRDHRLSDEQAERICRAEVWRRYGRRCEVPGCGNRQGLEQHHIIFRSKSRRLRFAPENRAVLCKVHHDLRHAGKIEILPRKADGELIVKGARKWLSFKL